MTFEVRTTPQSEEDLRGIYEYIAVQLQSPMSAAAQLDALMRSIFSLETMPERYQRYIEEPWHSRNLRVLPVDHYMVFYIPKIEDKENRAKAGVVTIVRVMYGGRDIRQQLSRFTDFKE